MKLKSIIVDDSSMQRMAVAKLVNNHPHLALVAEYSNAIEAKNSIQQAVQSFENISIDLIYGVPEVDDAQWLANIETALEFQIPHISAYALTVEPKTALAHFISQGKIKNVDDEQAERQFHLLVEILGNHDFVNYEISSFGKEGFFSKNSIGEGVWRCCVWGGEVVTVSFSRCW